jgi:hypothetical protein
MRNSAQRPLVEFSLTSKIHTLITQSCAQRSTIVWILEMVALKVQTIRTEVAGHAYDANLQGPRKLQPYSKEKKDSGTGGLLPDSDMLLSKLRNLHIVGQGSLSQNWICRIALSSKS